MALWQINLFFRDVECNPSIPNVGTFQFMLALDSSLGPCGYLSAFGSTWIQNSPLKGIIRGPIGPACARTLHGFRKSLRCLSHLPSAQPSMKATQKCISDTVSLDKRVEHWKGVEYVWSMTEIENTREKSFKYQMWQEKLWKNVKKTDPSHHTETSDIITSWRDPKHSYSTTKRKGPKVCTSWRKQRRGEGVTGATRHLPGGLLKACCILMLQKCNEPLTWITMNHMTWPYDTLCLYVVPGHYPTASEH